MRKAPGTYSPEDILILRQKQDNKCFYCYLSLKDYHVDHKVPLSKGGTNYKRNICLACPKCNLQKHDKTAKEFGDFLKRKAILRETE